MARHNHIKGDLQMTTTTTRILTTAMLVVTLLSTALLSGCLSSVTNATANTTTTEVHNENLAVYLANQEMHKLFESTTVEAGNMTGETGAYFSLVETHTTLAEDAVIEEGAIVMYRNAPVAETTSEGAMPSFGYHIVDGETANELARGNVSHEDIKALRATGKTAPQGFMPIPAGEYGNMTGETGAYFSLVKTPVVLAETAVIEEDAIVIYPSTPGASTTSEGALPTLPYQVVPVR